MEPNEALLLSVESILGDDELDDAVRNAALTETVQQYIEFMAEPAGATILKRTEPADDKASAEGFESDTSDVRQKLERLYEDQRRSFPNISDSDNLAAAWRRLNLKDRYSILAEDLGQGEGDAPTFKAEDVDVAALAQFALECRALAIGKTQKSLTRGAAFAAACDEKPWLLKIAREAKRAKLADGNVDMPAEAVAKRNYATQLLTAKANEIRKVEPTLSLQAARIEARRQWPDVAALERA